MTPGPEAIRDALAAAPDPRRASTSAFAAALFLVDALPRLVADLPKAAKASLAAEMRTLSEGGALDAALTLLADGIRAAGRRDAEARAEADALAEAEIPAADLAGGSLAALGFPVAPS